MAIVQRFFSTTPFGSGDATSWANRAQLHTGGTWSTVITGFNFSGSDSLQCFIGPGSYTITTTALQSSLFANAPSVANPLLLCGCDSSGVLLPVPDPDWVSARPAFDASSFPVLVTTTNIATVSLVNCWCYLMKFTASGRNGTVMAPTGMVWCVVNNTTANTATVTSTAARLVNCVLTASGSSYSGIMSAPTHASNTRVEGVAGSSGNRQGVIASATATDLDGLSVVNCGGEGVVVTSSSASQALKVVRSVIANNGAQGLKANSTASQTAWYEANNNMITGNGTAGIDGNSAAARWFVEQNRLRDNTTDITGLGNYPTDLNNYTTDSDDATEYVSAGADGDFRIKNTAAIWGMGFGVSDQPAPLGGIAIFGG